MSASEISHTVLQAQPVAVVRGQVGPQDIASFLASAFTVVAGAVHAQGKQVTGPPFGRYEQNSSGEWDITAGFPVDAPVSAHGGVEPAELPEGPAAYTVFQGPYAAMGTAYDRLLAAVVENGDRVAGVPWERYLDEPEAPEPRTEVFVPYERALHR